MRLSLKKNMYGIRNPGFKEESMLFHGSDFPAFAGSSWSAPDYFLEKCNRAALWIYVNLQFGSAPPFFAVVCHQLLHNSKPIGFGRTCMMHYFIKFVIQDYILSTAYMLEYRVSAPVMPQYNITISPTN